MSTLRILLVSPAEILSDHIDELLNDMIDEQFEMEEINRSTYSKKRMNRVLGCGYCGRHKGCNRKKDNTSRTWKRYRKTQHK